MLGDSLTTCDFSIAGFFVNVVLNEKNTMAEGWKAAWETAPEALKTYIANFQEEMKEYIDSRPQGCTM